MKSNYLIALLLLLQGISCVFGIKCFTCQKQVRDGQEVKDARHNVYNDCDSFSRANDTEKLEFADNCPTLYKACQQSIKVKNNGELTYFQEYSCFFASKVGEKGHEYELNKCVEIKNNEEGGETQRICTCDTDHCLLEGGITYNSKGGISLRGATLLLIMSLIITLV